MNKQVLRILEIRKTRDAKVIITTETNLRKMLFLN